jgi:hypothetical protein
MKRWIVAMAAVFSIGMLVSGIAGCGAKLPTKSEYDQGDPLEQKILTYTEMVENEEINTPAD